MRSRRIGRLIGLVGAMVAAGVLSVSLLGIAAAQVAPTAVNDTATVLEGQSVIINVLANDSPAGVTIASVGTPSNGTAIIASGSVVYSPKAGFHGTDTFPYTITNGTATASATVTVTVVPVNHAPVAKPDAVKTPVGTAVVIDVLKNDTDANGDALTVILLTTPAHGTVTLNATTQKVTYTPAAGFVGTDTFTYAASDGALISAPAIVTVTVQATEAPKDMALDAKVLAACAAYSGPGKGVASLCNLYTGNQVPVFVRARMGEVILRTAGPAVEAAAVCAQPNPATEIARLCEVYASATLPPGLQKKVGQLIVGWSQAASGSTSVGLSGGLQEKPHKGPKPSR